MGAPLKDMFSPEFYRQFAQDIQSLLPTFNSRAFQKAIFDAAWEERALKERMRHSSTVLHRFLPSDFPQAASILCALVRQLQAKGTKEQILEYCFLPDYVEQYGIEHFEASVQAIEIITQLSSCEFAVRPFLVRYPQQMMEQMLTWADHENAKVRRLASEGARPRLPWAIALPAFKKDPAPLLPLLEKLKQDPSEYVRRSVANAINDISKDNPDVALALVHAWSGASPETDRLLRHGSRTLLKRGEKRTLRHFGVESADTIELHEFAVHTATVAIGGDLLFSYSIKNNHSCNRIIRAEYCIYYKKASGLLSKKVFKLSERDYQPFEQAQRTKKHSFRVITTRRYYSGMHRVALILNGKEHHALSFELCL